MMEIEYLCEEKKHLRKKELLLLCNSELQQLVMVQICGQ